MTASSDLALPVKPGRVLHAAVRLSPIPVPVHLPLPLPFARRALARFFSRSSDDTERKKGSALSHKVGRDTRLTRDLCPCLNSDPEEHDGSSEPLARSELVIKQHDRKLPDPYPAPRGISTSNTSKEDGKTGY